VHPDFVHHSDAIVGDRQSQISSWLDRRLYGILRANHQMDVVMTAFPPKGIASRAFVTRLAKARSI